MGHKEDTKERNTTEGHQKDAARGRQKAGDAFHAAKSKVKKDYMDKVAGIHEGVKGTERNVPNGKADADRALAAALHEEAMRNGHIMARLREQESTRAYASPKPMSQREAFEAAAMAQLDDMSDDELRQTALLGLACSVAAVIGIGALAVGGIRPARRLVR